MRLFLLVLIAVAFALPSVASERVFTVTPFVADSGTQNVTKTSNAISTGRFNRKTVILQGYSSNDVAISALGGTATIECGATGSGPFLTAKDTSGNAVSTSSSAVYNLDDFCTYVRATWKRTSASVKKLSAYIFYSE